MARTIFRLTNLALAAVFTVAAYTTVPSHTARALPRTTLPAATPVAHPMTLQVRQQRALKRHTAMRWAKSQAGKPYVYGATGPGSYDCSGLVQAAYRRAGIPLPRTTYLMLDSVRLRQIPASQARWGDIVFTHAGHVELFSHREGGRAWMFGAHHSGTRISFKAVYSGGNGYPKYFRVAGAN